MSSCRNGSSGADGGCEKGKLTFGVQRTVPRLELSEVRNCPTLKKEQKNEVEAMLYLHLFLFFPSSLLHSSLLEDWSPAQPGTLRAEGMLTSLTFVKATK